MGGFLRKFSNLRILNLSTQRAQFSEMKSLSKVSTLRVLNLSKSRISPKALAAISGLFPIIYLVARVKLHHGLEYYEVPIHKETF